MSLILPQRAREEQARVEAEKLAEDRRLAREQALEWTREVRMDSDDDQEREKRPKRPKKAKADVASGDEDSKKKKRGKIKKSGNEQGEEDQVMFSEEDDAEKPTKKVRNPKSHFMAFVLYSFQRLSKKRVVRDDDDDEAVSHPRKKQ